MLLQGEQLRYRSHEPVWWELSSSPPNIILGSIFLHLGTFHTYFLYTEKAVLGVNPHGY